MDIIFNDCGYVNYGKKYNDSKKKILIKFNILKCFLFKCFTIQL